MTIYTVSTITFAIKAKKELQKHSIKSRIVKLNNKGTYGCQYGIEIPKGLELTCAAILRGIGIEYSIQSEEK